MSQNLHRLGNTKTDLPSGDLEKRVIAPVGITTDQRLVLKLYHIHTKGDNPPKETFELTQEFVTQKVEDGTITPMLGLGFIIGSNGYLNIARWSDEIPILPINQVWRTNGWDPRGAEIEIIEGPDIGSFCVHEMPIATFEARAWLKYLKSNRDNTAKNKYLRDIMRRESWF